MDLSAALDRESPSTRPRVDAEAQVLVGSTCRACGARSWPGRAVCHRCGAADVVDRALERVGSLLSLTTVWVPRPGLDVPYVLGQVQIGDVRVYAHVRGLDAGAALPLPVAVVVAADPAALPRFWFEPA